MHQANIVDPLDIMRSFSHNVMQDFMGRLSNRRRVLQRIITEKFRPHDSCREIHINASRGNCARKEPTLVVRFLEHDDRFRTTCNTRQVRRAIHLKINGDTLRNLEALYKQEIKDWLTTNERTVRAPEVPMPVAMNSVKPVDILMPAAFEIASVPLLAESSKPFYRMQNAAKDCYYDIPVSEWIFAKEPEEFVGSFVVTNFNGDRQIIAANIFHVQFMAVH